MNLFLKILKFLHIEFDNIEFFDDFDQNKLDNFLFNKDNR